jgi:hypothetical protein
MHSRTSVLTEYAFDFFVFRFASLELATNCHNNSHARTEE